MDFANVPHLMEILNFLPLDSSEEDISVYLKNTTDFIVLNYFHEQYTFSYLGLHLLCMIYIYISVWKINLISPKEYATVIAFAKTYDGRELSKLAINSVFDYSHIPEKELPKIFKIIGLDDGQIGKIRGLVETRNDIAHATNNSEIPNEDAFDNEASTILSFMSNIHNRMDGQIRNWFINLLAQYCKGEYNDYSNLNDFILEQMVQNFNLSVSELLICNEMSVRSLITKHPEHRECLLEFKQGLKKYCKNNDYLV